MSQAMPKDFNTDMKVASNALPSSTPTYSSLVEDHAAQLMDEIFQALDQAMEPLDVPLPSASPSQSESSSLVSLKTLTEQLGDRSSELLVPYVAMDATLDSLYVDPTPYEAIRSPQPEQEKGGSRLSLWLACIACIGSAGLWVGTQINRPAPSPMVAQASIPPQNTAAANPADVAFATESEQLLQTAEATAPVSPSPLGISPLGIAAPPTAALTPLGPSIIPSTLASTPPPTLTPQPVSVKPAVITPAISSQGVAKAKSSTVAQAAKSTKSLLKGPQTIALATIPNVKPGIPSSLQAPPLSATAPLPNLAPQALPVAERPGKSGIMVQGVLDLGPQSNKSAMLIVRNGSTQNIRLGDVLDASGWTFVRTENGQAIIQRGNEVRAVSGGEQF